MSRTSKEWERCSLGRLSRWHTQVRICSVVAYHLRVVNGDRFGCIKITLPFADPNREEFRMATELKLFRNAGQSQRSRFVVLVTFFLHDLHGDAAASHFPISYVPPISATFPLCWFCLVPLVCLRSSAAKRVIMFTAIAVSSMLRPQRSGNPP